MNKKNQVQVQQKMFKWKCNVINLQMQIQNFLMMQECEKLLMFCAITSVLKELLVVNTLRAILARLYFQVIRLSGVVQNHYFFECNSTVRKFCVIGCVILQQLVSYSVLIVSYLQYTKKRHCQRPVVIPIGRQMMHYYIQ